jgi:hypothetical protein
MVISFYVLLVPMQGESDDSYPTDIDLSFSSSEFVSTQIIRDLYQCCCAKRFKAYNVQPPQVTESDILYKYVIFRRPEGNQPRAPLPRARREPPSPSVESQMKPNPMKTHHLATTAVSEPQPNQLHRRNSKQPTVSTIGETSRYRSDTLPFTQENEDFPYISTMRTGNAEAFTASPYQTAEDPN